MKKKLLALFGVATAAAMTLTACAGSGTTASSTSSTASAADSGSATSSAAGSPAAGSSAAPAPQETIPFNLATVGPTTALLPQYVAQDKGFFTEQGLEATFITVASGAAMLPALTAGQVDSVSNSLQVEVKLLQSGEKVKAVAGYSVGYDYAVYVRNGVDVPLDGTFEQKMQALNGKTVGAQGGEQGSTVAFFQAMMRAGGGDPTTVTYANVAYGGPQIAALQSGEVDAVIADDSTSSTADQLGLGHVYFDMLTDPPAQYKDLLISAVISTDAFLAANPTFAARYAAGLNEAIEWMKDPANIDDLHRIAVDVQGIPDAPDLNDRLSKLGSLFEVYVPRAQAEASLDFLFTSGQLPPDPKVTVDEFFAPTTLK